MLAWSIKMLLLHLSNALSATFLNWEGKAESLQAGANGSWTENASQVDLARTWNLGNTGDAAPDELTR